VSIPTSVVTVTKIIRLIERNTRLVTERLFEEKITWISRLVRNSATKTPMATPISTGVEKVKPPSARLA
jgi:hypothetical protein